MEIFFKNAELSTRVGRKRASHRKYSRDKEIEENTEKANQRASPKKPIPNNRDSRKRRKEINSLVQKDVCQN